MEKLGVILSPSILAADFNILGEQIRQAEAAGAEYLHLDVMDGKFVPAISFGMPLIKSIRKNSKMFFDTHLMIEEPVRYIKDFAEAGADGITIHLEAAGEKTEETLKAIKEMGLKAGISLNPKTPAEAVKPYIKTADMILVMSVEPGFGGQKFIESSLQKVKDIKQMLIENNVDIPIEIDGGINMQNCRSVVCAGVDIIVSGSSIFKDDIAANIEKMRKLSDGVS